MKVAAVIPARYDSQRFPGKVLAKDTGKFLIEHTYERALLAKIPSKVVIAVDSRIVADACAQFGAPYIMTRPEHASGTDRIAEVAANLDSDIIVNIQGDEPEMDPANIDILAGLLINAPDCGMATLVAQFDDARLIPDPNIVKAVVDSKGYAIYFSRSVIPYDRSAGGAGDAKNYLRHLGAYAYRKDFLLKITAMEQGRLEKIEKLEQLRVLENGYKILTAKVRHNVDGIDTAAQYAEFVKRYKKSH